MLTFVWTAVFAISVGAVESVDKEINATKLQSRAVSSVAPYPGQVLAWNQSAAAWAPSQPVPSGTWCGNSSSRVRCMGHSPASSCPAGYAQDYLGGSNGEIITFFCVKR